MIGVNVSRREDERLVRGQGNFVSHLRLPHLAQAVILRSPHAQARIKHIKTASARQAPGVLAVMTFADLADCLTPIPQFSFHRSLQSRTPYPLACDEVRYVGEPVAIVVAEDAYVAWDALELIEVEYEPLRAILDPTEALSETAPRVHTDLPDNIAAQFEQEVGAVDKALAQAHLVLTRRFTIGRVSAQPLETRAVLALYEPCYQQGRMTVWATTQQPHNTRSILSQQLGLPPHQVRVIAPDLGGGFGVKSRYYPEDTLIPLLAQRLRRPVKWVEDRRESFCASYHEREQYHEITMGLAADGSILAIRDHFIYDQGAYTPLGVVVPYVTSVSIPGPYRIPNYAVECTSVFTNKTPSAPYRGAGKPQATFVRERMLDLGAQALQLDPAEIRRRNLLSPHEFPYDTGLIDLDDTRVVYDSGDYRTGLERALALIGYEDFPHHQRLARQQGRYLGIGLACYLEMSGRGPYEGALVRVEANGRVMVYSGISAQGQSHETTLAQVCADYLGVSLETVNVVVGDTADIPLGIGAYAGRSAVMAGTAVAQAATAVREKALRTAAYLLQLAPSELELKEGRISVCATPEQGITLGEVARRLYSLHPKFPFPDEFDPGLEATSYFKNSRPAYSNGTYVAVVEVDPQTGLVKLLRHALVDDCGTRINPRVVDGQLRGGVAQGVGAALSEEICYDQAGQLYTQSLQDYLLPTTLDVPPLQLAHLTTISPFNPLGVKGVGEAGTIPVAAAINSAIENALGGAVTLLHTPVHAPDLWGHIQAGEAKT